MNHLVAIEDEVRQSPQQLKAPLLKILLHRHHHRPTAQRTKLIRQPQTVGPEFGTDTR
jgi:hypothetical protein